MITVNLDKAKDIAHEKRREARAEEFKPHDEVIMKQIPGNDMAEAEAARQAIRVKYETIQADIESAEDVVELKQILDTMSE
jgi:hypothetical protein